jgi:hypothetical protein
MATGDQQDFFKRIKARMPSGWFGSTSPILDALLGGIASAFVTVYAAYQYLLAQTRLQTSTDGWLDLSAADYFGESGLSRLANETDPAYRTRIKINIIRERGTRAALVKILTDLTGRAPVIVEPTRPQDTGAYGGTDAITVLSAQIYRNDWQGNQLLYSTARTNALGQSEGFSSGWTITRASLTQPGLQTLRGTLAYKLVEDTSATTTHFLQRTSIGTFNTGDIACVSVLARAGERTQIRLGTSASGGFASTSIVADLSAMTTATFSGSPFASGITPLSAGWYRVWCAVQATSSGAATAQCILANGGTSSYTGDGASGLYIDAAQIESATTFAPGPTSYIACPTTAVVTVTDYALSSNGALALASAPLIGSGLTWTGSYQSTVRSAVVAVSAQTFGSGDGISTAFSIAPKYGYAIGYGIAGAYGSLLHNYQAFVKAYRPAGSGLPYLQGYGTSPGGYATPSRAAYANIGDMTAGVTDAAIYAAIASVLPVATIAWVAISN